VTVNQIREYNWMIYDYGLPAAAGGRQSAVGVNFGRAAAWPLMAGGAAWRLTSGLRSPSPAVPARRNGVRRTGEGEDRKTNSSIWARNEGSRHDALTLRNPNNNEGSSSNYIGLLGLKCT